MEPTSHDRREGGVATLSRTPPDRRQLLELIEQLRQAGWYVMSPLSAEPPGEDRQRD